MNREYENQPMYELPLQKGSVSQLTNRYAPPRLEKGGVSPFIVMPDIAQPEIQKPVEPQVPPEERMQIAIRHTEKRKQQQPKRENLKESSGQRDDPAIRAFWEEQVATGKVSQEKAEEAIRHGIRPMRGGAPIPAEMVAQINPERYGNELLRMLARNARTFGDGGVLDEFALNNLITDAQRLQTDTRVDEQEARELLTDLNRVRILVQAERETVPRQRGGQEERNQEGQRQERSGRQQREALLGEFTTTNPQAIAIRERAASFETADELKEDIRSGELGNMLRSVMTTYGRNPDMVDVSMDVLLNKRSVEDIRRQIDEDLIGINIAARILTPEQEAAAFQSELSRTPKNIHETSEIIMAQYFDFSRKGKYPLLVRDRETGKDIFQQDNFLKWIRSQLRHHDSLNPDDVINMFTDVSVQGNFRNFTWMQMYNSDNYFIDPENNGKVMEEFREQCNNEIWLFHESRNWDVQYKVAMGVEETLASTLQKMFYKNTFTKTAPAKTTLEMVLTMPKKYRIFDNGGDKLGGEGEDQLVGKGVRKALLAYNYIADIDMLKKILGEDSVFFKKAYEGFNPENEKELEEAKDKGWNPDWYDVSGILKFHDKDVVKNFLKYIDIYDVKADPRMINEVRARMREAILQSSNGQLDNTETAYAEVWAFRMLRWTGIAARNSADAWHKWQHTEDYRTGQGAAKRAGFYGNPYNVESLRGIGFSLLDGITTTDGRTLREIIQGGEGSNLGNIDEDIKPFFFRQNTMQKFADDHITRVQKIFEFIVENNEMNFDQFTHYDPIRGVVFDHDKAKAVLDGIAKHLRYAYGTWDILALNKKVRIYDQEKEEYRDVTIAETMFGGHILDKYKNGKGELNEEGAKRMQDEYAKDGTFWRNVFVELIAREIQSHTDVNSPYKIYEYVEREKIYDFLRQHVLSKKELAQARKTAKTPFWRMFFRELILQTFIGAVKGLKEAGEKVVEEAVK